MLRARSLAVWLALVGLLGCARGTASDNPIDGSAGDGGAAGGDGQGQGDAGPGLDDAGQVDTLDPDAAPTDVPVDTPVTPSAHILINEVNTSDAVELFNPTGVAVDISGWKLTLYPGEPYTFAAGTMMAADGILLMDDSVGTDSPTHKDFNFGVFWSSSTRIEVVLQDGSGGTVDYLAFHIPGAGPNKPADHPWSSGLAQTSDGAWRKTRIDTDSASDWGTGDVAGTLGMLNSGQ